MDARDRLLRDFEAATSKLVTLEQELAHAKSERDRLKKALKAAMSGTGHADTSGAQGEVPTAVLEAVDVVRHHGEPLDATILSALMNIDKGAARTRLQRGVKYGLLRRASRGHYDVIETDDEATT